MEKVIDQQHCKSADMGPNQTARGSNFWRMGRFL